MVGAYLNNFTRVAERWVVELSLLVFTTKVRRRGDSTTQPCIHLNRCFGGVSESTKLEIPDFG